MSGASRFWIILCHAQRIEKPENKFKYAGYASYNEYLRSNHWKETRKRALERAGNQCSICRSTKRLNVHHNNYDRLGKELDTDLTVLCEKCHDLFYREGKLSKPDAIDATNVTCPLVSIPAVL